MRYQQLLGLLGNRDKGGAQGPDPDRRSQLMLAQDMGGGVQSQRPRKLARASAGKSSLSISAQALELIVISDSEPESEDNNDH